MGHRDQGMNIGKVVVHQELKQWKRTYGVFPEARMELELFGVSNVGVGDKELNFIVRDSQYLPRSFCAAHAGA